MMLILVLMALLLFQVAFITNVAIVLASPSGGWIQTYGTETNKDRAESLIQCTDGGYVIAGNTNVSTTPPRNQLWLLKTDALGKMEWNKTYGSIGSAIGRCVIQTSDGGYAIAGTVNRVAEVVKIDSAGNIQWDRTFGEAAFAYFIIQTLDGGYALSGSTGGSGPSMGDNFWLIKIDSSGGSLWSKTYSQTSGSAASVIQTIDGGFAMIGSTQNSDFLLVKTNSQGIFEWSKTYGSEDMDAGYSIVQNPDGSFVMAGLLWNRTTFGEGSMGVGLVKADSAGNQLWLKNYPGSGSPSSMTHGSDGSYILCSSMLDKIDAGGNLIWSKNVSFDGIIGKDHAGTTYLAVQTSDGGYAVAGTVSSAPSNPLNIISYVWIGKLDSEGNKTAFIPEFSSVAILILVVIVCIVAVAFKKHLANVERNGNISSHQFLEMQVSHAFNPQNNL